MSDICPELERWRVWPAAGASFTVMAECVHQHIPGGDWTMRRGGQVVVILQSCGTVAVNETAQEKDQC